MDKSVFLTGATGFIGSHVAQLLVESGLSVMALKRSTSKPWRCAAFEEKITWVTEDTLEASFGEFRPDVVIHLAWEGISAADRDNWQTQFANLNLLFKLTALAGQYKTHKFIAFGSQAEYGVIEGRVNESQVPDPTNAYGVAKLAAQKAVKLSCEAAGIDWYWLRIYSVFGPREDQNWFVPMIINNLLRDLPCQLSPCEQRYDYLYVKDLAQMIFRVVDSPANNSGIYNVSSGRPIALKSVITAIDSIVGSSSALSFGALPYRANQSMHIEGDNEKYCSVFGTPQTTRLEVALDETIDYYRVIL